MLRLIVLEKLVVAECGAVWQLVCVDLSISPVTTIGLENLALTAIVTIYGEACEACSRWLPGTRIRIQRATPETRLFYPIHYLKYETPGYLNSKS